MPATLTVLWRCWAILALCIFTALLVAPRPAEAAPTRVGIVLSWDSIEFGALKAPKMGVKLSPTTLAARPDVTYRTFLERGYAPAEIFDEDLTNARLIGRYQVVVLPYTIVMDERQSRVLSEYVESGGGLVAIYAAPRLTLAGKPWRSLLNSPLYTWGPLSAVYQIQSISDQTLEGYTVKGKGRHPILLRTFAERRQRVVFNFSRGSGAEMTSPWPDRKISSILELSNGFSGGWAGTHGRGRFVYFTFPVMDFIWRRDMRLANDQGRLAEELIIQAAEWAAGA